MALEGSIKDFGLADIFQLIHIQKKTGTLLVESKRKKATIYFENGMIVSATTTPKKDIEKIGRILIRSKKITKRQLKTALKAQKETPYRVGYILEKTGNVTKPALKDALQLQVNETVFNLFRWKEGRYVFEQKEIDYDREYLQPINTEFILMEAIRQLDEWQFIEKKIPSYDIVCEKVQEGDLRLSTDTIKSEEDLFFDIGEDKEKKEEKGKVTLTEEERIVYELVDGLQDVSSIIETGKIGEFETCKALSNLLTAGLIRVRFQPAEPLKKRRFRINLSRVADLAPIALMAIKGLIAFGIIMGFYTTLDLKGNFKEMRDGLNSLKMDIVKARIINFADAMELYFIERGEYPSSLRSLVNSGLIDKNGTLDTWGREYVIQPLENSNISGYKLYSLGPDGIEGTKDDITYPE